MEVAGGIECAHGPQYDPANCPPDWNRRRPAQYCAEKNGGQPWDPAQPNKICWCFKCGLANACENEIWDLTAFCGWETEQQKHGNCAEAFDLTKPAVPLRVWRAAKTPDGVPCQFSSRPGEADYRRKKYCGRSQTIGFGCVSTNGCKGDESADWFVLSGPLPVCPTAGDAPPRFPSVVNPSKTRPFSTDPQ